MNSLSSTSKPGNNSVHLDLTHWYLTVPVDAKGGTTGLAANLVNLTKYQSKYFYHTVDSGVVFNAPVNGATTAHSYGARTELRELNTDGSYAFWNLAKGGTLTATLAVNHIPTYVTGKPGKEIIGQIHGKDHELVRLYYENNTVYFKNDRSGSSNTEHKFLLTDSSGHTPNVSLNEKFSYMIDAHGSALTVKLYVDNHVYSSVTSINPIWQSDTLYFKAGVYLGVTATPHVDVGQGSGYGQNTFYGLEFSHVRGQGVGGLLSTTTASAPSASHPVSKEITGTSGHDTLNADHERGTVVKGRAGNDQLSGHDGNDTLYGDNGHDHLFGYWGTDSINGGVGNDVINGGPGRDKLTGGQGNDQFKYGAIGDAGDIITDFHHLIGDMDTLDLTALFSANGLGSVDTAAAINKGYLELVKHTDGLHVEFDRDGAAGAKYAPVLMATLVENDRHLDLLHQILTHET